MYQKHLNLTCLTFSKQELVPQTCLATSPCTYLVPEAKSIGSFLILHVLAFSTSSLFAVLQSQPENCHEFLTSTTTVSGQTTIISQLVSPLPLLFPLNSIHSPHSRNVSYNVNHINIKSKSDRAIPPLPSNIKLLMVFYCSWNDI